jgi:hypothetical protein
MKNERIHINLTESRTKNGNMFVYDFFCYTHEVYIQSKFSDEIKILQVILARLVIGARVGFQLNISCRKVE